MPSFNHNNPKMKSKKNVRKQASDKNLVRWLYGGMPGINHRNPKMKLKKYVRKQASNDNLVR